MSKSGLYGQVENTLYWSKRSWRMFGCPTWSGIDRDSVPTVAAVPVHIYGSVHVYSHDVGVGPIVNMCNIAGSDTLYWFELFWRNIHCIGLYSSDKHTSPVYYKIGSGSGQIHQCFRQNIMIWECSDMVWNFIRVQWHLIRSLSDWNSILGLSHTLDVWSRANAILLEI